MRAMLPVARTFIALGSLAVLLAVALGAFGAHALRARLTLDLLAIYRTGVESHFFHALQPPANVAEALAGFSP